MLIKVYGEFWNPDLVSWGKKGPGGGGKLEGKVAAKGEGTPVNHWDQSGIYVLYQDHDLVYVGQARRDLGARLRQHRTDRRAGRWNRFSWYGLYGGDEKTGKLVLTEPSLPSTRDILDEVEAILISATEPRLNKQQGRFGVDVSRLDQNIPEEPATIEQRIWEKLQEVEVNIAKLAKPTESPSPPPVKKRGRPKKADKT